MKRKEAAKVKGDIKAAAMQWAGGKVDAIFPNQPAMRVMLKKGVENTVKRYSAEADKWMDMVFALLGDGQDIDTDGMIDLLLDVYAETKAEQVKVMGCNLTIGAGEVKIQMPDNAIIRLLIGGNDTVKFTRDDFAEIKGMLNN